MSALLVGFPRRAVLQGPRCRSRYPPALSAVRRQVGAREPRAGEITRCDVKPGRLCDLPIRNAYPWIGILESWCTECSIMDSRQCGALGSGLLGRAGRAYGFYRWVLPPFVPVCDQGNSCEVMAPRELAISRMSHAGLSSRSLVVGRETCGSQVWQPEIVAAMAALSPTCRPAARRWCS